ncbi:uncharacterized protein LOC143368172 isoform X2 [Andrena cerasifolii]|uniref:uncharacterized protein LOC143368172 isoform X2 n=1 Tax=Andrena cerasifolii TaxID=2819439 RepID=UPI004037A51D
MMKCNWDECNLKSTAYNQCGQNYFEQLTAYNSMTSHLRRILLAKCVVDARNKSYMCRRKQLLKQCNRKSRSARIEITNSLIDRLAYDTLHHPADLLGRSCVSRYLCQCDEQKYFADCYDYDVICSRSRLQKHVICPALPMSKASTSEFVKSSGGGAKQQAKTEFTIEDVSERRYEEDSMLYEPVSDYLTQGNNQLSMPADSSRSYENSDIAALRVNMIANRDASVKGEDAKCAKFVYEITREIMHDGLYTDNELREVFKKHVERNKDILDMDTMLYEIYQLKLHLNMSYDSDDEEFQEHLDYKFSNILKVCPPTPPKVLDENKVLDRLMYHKLNEDADRSTHKRERSVLVVDANPELIVTETDILASLIESDIAPEQAQQIYKRLSYRSKNTVPPDLVR